MYNEDFRNSILERKTKKDKGTKHLAAINSWLGLTKEVKENAQSMKNGL